ncbi:hypothetical protein BC937DRAFT_93205 [Endogone sp. FLAS-F59071]|nr:hypothetical protein BC937DRAFT_93205 [Endogone sp. FLAS-F59071]|eukprot:RUS14870.1 hypothetical protein BC937DRAFT_93205 [Endogone sp. FLAS-F59071]
MNSDGNRSGTSAVIPIAFIPPGQNGEALLSPSQSALRLSLGFASTSPSIAPLPPAAGTGLSLGFQKSYDPRISTRSENPFDDLEDEESVQVKTAVSKTVVAIGSTTTLQAFDPSSSVSTFNLGSPANRMTVDSEFYGSDGDRDSIATVNQPIVPATQAIQVLRAKPQMMRINTIRSTDNNRISRTGSVRTMMSNESHTTIDMDPNLSPDINFMPPVPMEFQSEVLNVVSSSIPQPQHKAPAPGGGVSVVKVSATIAEESDESDDEDHFGNAAAQRNESPFDNRHSVVDDEEEEDAAGAHNVAMQAQQLPTTLAGPIDGSRLSATLPGGNSSDRSASMMTARTNRTNATDSVMSSLGDGEITIMWGGYRNSEVPEGEDTAHYDENQGDILEMMMEEGQEENKNGEEEEEEA